MTNLHALGEAIAAGDRSSATSITRAAVDDGTDPRAILAGTGMLPGVCGTGQPRRGSEAGRCSLETAGTQERMLRDHGPDPPSEPR